MDFASRFPPPAGLPAPTPRASVRWRPPPRALQDAGATVEAVDPPAWNIRRSYLTVVEAAFGGVVAALPGDAPGAARSGPDRDGAARHDDLRRRRAGAEIDRIRLMRVFIAFLDQYDLLLTPCVPIAPFQAGDERQYAGRGGLSGVV